jgi:membrane-bound lytic murein transglycosylase B
MQNKDTYIAKMKLQLDELEVKMNALEAKAKDAKDAAHDKYVEEIAKMRAQSKIAKAKLDTLVDASEDKWDDLVVEMEKVRDAFVHSFNYFKSQLK